jgi:dihydroneopterin aldolase
MYHINLKNLEFYAYHGYYQEENLIGNTFLVDIMVAIPAAVYENENLGSTINYEIINEIVKTQMQNPQKLLETVLQNIEKQLLILSNQLQKVEIHLTKKHLPIDGFIGQAMVSLIKNYEK